MNQTRLSTLKKSRPILQSKKMNHFQHRLTKVNLFYNFPFLVLRNFLSFPSSFSPSDCARFGPRHRWSRLDPFGSCSIWSSTPLRSSTSVPHPQSPVLDVAGRAPPPAPDARHCVHDHGSNGGMKRLHVTEAACQ
jgi:hypothetical protein